jgi:hypothetical protein
MHSFGSLRRFVPAIALVLGVISLAAPSRAADDVSETRAVSGFERIRLQGAFSAEITAGEPGARFVATGDRDVVGRITTAVEDGTLVVGMRPGFDFGRRAPKLEIALPKLRGFVNEGAGTAKITGLNGGDVEIENSGTASIVVSGRAANEAITLNGTGKIDAADVEARDVTVDNNGVGTVHVRASGSLTMNVNGVGTIRYSGNPTHVESRVNGVGSIRPL